MSHWYLEISHYGRVYTVGISTCYEWELFAPWGASCQTFISTSLLTGLFRTQIGTPYSIPHIGMVSQRYNSVKKKISWDANAL